MHTFIIVLIIIVAILIIFTVLLQSSKGSGLAGGFGSLGSVQSMGVRQTADFLSKTTGILATVFMLLCVLAEITMPTAGDNEVKESVIQKNIQQVPISPSVPLPGDLKLDDMPAAPDTN